MAAFPCDITNLLKASFTATAPRKTKGLGRKSLMIKKPTVTVTAHFKTQVEISTYLYWWINMVDYGADAFTIELPFFGINRTWNVSIMNDSTESLAAGLTRTLNMQLKILDDLDTITRDDLLGTSTIIYTMDVSTDGSGNRYLENEA